MAVMQSPKNGSQASIDDRALRQDGAISGEAGVITIDPERLSGAPCFAGTRVPIQTLWDYLEAGDSLGEFLDGFPGVTREQAIAVLELARQHLATSLVGRADSS